MATDGESVVQINAATSGGGGKKKKPRALALNELLDTLPDLGNWSDVVESTAQARRDHNEIYNKSELPDGPRTVRGPVEIDTSRIPPDGPYEAYIGNLPYDIDKETIREAFEEFHVTDVRIIADHFTKRSRGFAYATFSERDDLVAALSRNGQNVCGRDIKVDIHINDRGNHPRYQQQSTGRRNGQFNKQQMHNYQENSMGRYRQDSYGSQSGGPPPDPEHPCQPNSYYSGDAGYDQQQRYSQGRQQGYYNNQNNTYGGQYRANYQHGYQTQNYPQGYSGMHRRGNSHQERRSSYSGQHADHREYYQPNYHEHQYNNQRAQNRTYRPSHENYEYRQPRVDYKGTYQLERSSVPPQTDIDEDHDDRQAERRPLVLQPRTKPLQSEEEEIEEIPNMENARKSSIFGKAKPVDTAAKEKEIEQRLVKEREELHKQSETEQLRGNRRRTSERTISQSSDATTDQPRLAPQKILTRPKPIETEVVEEENQQEISNQYPPQQQNNNSHNRMRTFTRGGSRRYGGGRDDDRLQRTENERSSNRGIAHGNFRGRGNRGAHRQKGGGVYRSGEDMDKTTPRFNNSTKSSSGGSNRNSQSDKGNRHNKTVDLDGFVQKGAKGDGSKKPDKHEEQMNRLDSHKLNESRSRELPKKSDRTVSYADDNKYALLQQSDE